MKKLLVAFDFDHTIIDANSDIVIRHLVPTADIPEEVKHLYKQEGWTAYMQQIFNILHDHKVTERTMLKECRLFQPTAGMMHLLPELKKTLAADVIIISDSNSVFIGEWLRSKGLARHVDAVYTNPAHFDDAGRLLIDMYHVQDWCTLSTRNLCKGHILTEHVKHRDYDVVAYVGDGKNDLCPSLELKPTDYVFPRVGYPLVEALNECVRSKSHVVAATVQPWASGNDILETLKRHLLNTDDSKGASD